VNQGATPNQAMHLEIENLLISVGVKDRLLIENCCRETSGSTGDHGVSHRAFVLSSADWVFRPRHSRRPTPESSALEEMTSDTVRLN